MNVISTVLAFDLGASSGRALIGQLIEDQGTRKLRVEEIHRFPNQAIQVGKHLHWDTLRLFQEMKEGIRKAFQAGYRPETLGIDTWGVDFGLLDANGEMIGNPYHYRDPHTEGLIEELNERFGAERLYEEGGLQFMPFNTIYQLTAMLKANSPKLDMAKTLLLTPDLLAYFLTGVKVCEFTMATTTQLYHPLKQEWNTELMDALGIPSHLFLDPIHPGTRVGTLTEDIQKELDVPAMDVIAVGTHDTESAIAAVPAKSDSFAYLVCGTWSLLGTEQQKPIVSREAMELSFSNEGGVGNRYQLLKNIMGLWIVQECKRDWDAQGKVFSFAELVKLAESAAGLQSIINPDDARFFAPGDMPEKVQSFCRETGQPVPETEGAIIRVVLDSLALCYRHELTRTEQLTGQSYDGLHMVGGGIQNTLLCQLTANALQRPVWTGPIEGSAIGNMTVQWMAQGHCGSLEEARQLVLDSFPIETLHPEEGEQSNWDASYERFTGLLHAKSQVACDASS